MVFASITLALRHGAPEARNMKPERDRAVA
jgi:hypothetical protein